MEQACRCLDTLYISSARPFITPSRLSFAITLNE
jgi:hypothetical protein